MFRKNNKRNTIKEKLNILKDIESEIYKQELIAIKYGIQQSAVSKIKKNKEKIKSLSLSNYKKDTKSLSKGKYIEIKNILKQYLQTLLDYKIPVSPQLLKEKALEIGKKLNNLEFKASDSWFSNFKKRNNLNFCSIQGNEDLVSKEGVIKWRERKLNEILKQYLPENIFNIDETGLMYDLMPDKSICQKNISHKFYTSSKNRITLLLGCNFTGTKKLVPLVIGHSKNPRCFKGIKSFPVDYCSNSSAWMNFTIFNNWLIKIDNFQKIKKEKIAIILDNAPCHNIFPSTKLEFIDLHFLPPNTTCILQPLDQL